MREDGMLYLHGVGHFHPDNVIDNAFLEGLDIGTDDEWIVSRVGIHERRTCLPLDYIRETKNQDVRASIEASELRNAECGARAAKLALERAGLSLSDIGMVVAGSCAPDTCIPAEASAVACELGIEVPAFDMHSACSTFGMHLHFLAQMGNSLPDYVLTVIVENISRVTDYSNRSSAVLFGDCATAAVVSTKHAARCSIAHSSFGGAPSGALDVVIPRAGYFAQNGSRVQKFAIKRMSQLYRECQQIVGADRADATVYLGHQANLTMLKSVAKRCQVAPDKHWFNIDYFGNVGAAGAPSVLSQHWHELTTDDAIAMVVVGAGLSWSSALIDVQD
jgi:3-oxoacyl-[acyl-carrier-protein] synthase-3